MKNGKLMSGTAQFVHQWRSDETIPADQKAPHASLDESVLIPKCLQCSRQAENYVVIGKIAISLIEPYFLRSLFTSIGHGVIPLR